MKVAGRYGGEMLDCYLEVYGIRSRCRVYSSVGNVGVAYGKRSIT